MALVLNGSTLKKHSVGTHWKCLGDIIGLDKRGYQANIFLISPQKHMLWYSLEVPRRGASNEYHNICFRGEIRRISILLD